MDEALNIQTVYELEYATFVLCSFSRVPSQSVVSMRDTYCIL